MLQWRGAVCSALGTPQSCFITSQLHGQASTGALAAQQVQNMPVETTSGSMRPLARHGLSCNNVKAQASLEAQSASLLSRKRRTSPAAMVERQGSCCASCCAWHLLAVNVHAVARCIAELRGGTGAGAIVVLGTQVSTVWSNAMRKSLSSTSNSSRCLALCACVGVQSVAAAFALFWRGTSCGSATCVGLRPLADAHAMINNFVHENLRSASFNIDCENMLRGSAGWTSSRQFKFGSALCC